MSARRLRLSWRDTTAVALLGPRTRPTRAALSALGIAVGIAALVAITGATDSQKAQMRADLDASGANLLVASSAKDQAGEVIAHLPETSPGMVRRIGPVRAVGSVRTVPGAKVYRSDHVPEASTGGIGAAVADDELLAALDLAVADGRWFDAASRTLPTVVLGSVAAQRLGIVDAAGARVLVDGEWYAVIGILEPAGLASEIDTTVFLPDRWRPERVGEHPLSRLYVRAASGAADGVRDVLAPTANPRFPNGVDVSTLSELAGAQEATDSAMSSLVLGLSGIALLVGGIGIANTMIVAVMERRGEIGLRRALGARRGQITGQFVLEAVALAVLGGLAGTVLGALTVVGLTTWQGTVLRIAPTMLVAGPVVALLIGAVAGLYPAARAAGLPPREALRAG